MACRLTWHSFAAVFEFFQFVKSPVDLVAKAVAPKNFESLSVHSVLHPLLVKQQYEVDVIGSEARLLMVRSLRVLW